MLYELALLFILTFIPALELRYTIPAGILAGKINLPFGMSLTGYGLPWYYVVPVVFIANILVGPLMYFILHYVVKLFLHFKWFSNFYYKVLERSQRKVKESVDKYGIWGVAIFIGVPLPGTGVYTGAIGSYALGMSFKKFIIADIVGVLIAGTAVTLLSLGVLSL